MNDSWFTVESPEPDTFIISEYQHWEETHCYLLCGTKQAVLIDTGLGVRSIRLLTNNPQKVVGLEGHGLHITGREPLVVEPGQYNRDYMDTKRDRMDHIL